MTQEIKLMTTASPPATLAQSTRHPDSHYAPLLGAFPQWLGQASTRTRSDLKNAQPQHAVALANAPAPLKTALSQHTAELWTARNNLDQALAHVQDARAFAKPILEDALLTRFSLNLDAEAIFVRLYIPQHVPWFPSLTSGAARAWTVSLLDAALHNFDAQEMRPQAYEAGSTFITRPSDDGQFDTLPAIKQALSIAAFTRLCRELDIGARYATYLREALGMTEPVARAVLQHKVNIHQKAALRAALQVARVQGDIQADYARAIEDLIAGLTGVTIGGRPMVCHALSMMDAPLTGILLFAPDPEHARTVQRVVAYVPDDPQHPLKEYASSRAFQQTLAEQLRDEQYQGFFSRFVAHAQRGVFFADLKQRLARITWHPPKPGDGQAPWREEPIAAPTLQVAATPISGDVWQHLYQQTLNKLLNDARTLAVPTADADRNARWALWDSFVSVASSVLNAVLLVVAPFIPGLGELMLGYMAYQLLDEVFEGIVDWAQGLDKQAFGHLMNILESLVQAGIFVAGSTLGVTELRKLLPQNVLTFIDRFKPVTLANGKTRYWKPDLKPYQQAINVPPRLGHDGLGLLKVRDEAILPLAGQHYAVEQTPGTGRYVIKHPSRPDAYRPTLTHNGAGAWHSELEQPMQWDSSTLLQRLGHRAHDLSDADRALALQLSGVDEAALRRMHVRGDPLPPLLSDTLSRMRINRAIEQLIEQLRSDDPAVYHAIDPQDQLQLLTSYGYWPTAKALHFLDAEGNVAWRFGESDRPVVQIHEAQLKNGDLLKTVLAALSPEEIRVSFGERASDPQLSLDTRAKNLRRVLADIAERQRAQLFDSRYALPQPAPSAAAQRLIDTAPGLPVNVAEHLLEHATGSELHTLDQQRTPPRLAQLAMTAMREVRLNRAYEGQHLDATAGIDSDRLALNSLKLMPRWSPRVRLVARYQSSHGPVWNSVGPADATIVRTLVRTDDGRYVPYDDRGALFGETDLYSAILKALPDAQRDALGIQVTDGPELKRRLRQRPLPRDELRVVLSNGAPKAPSLETLRLLGNNGGYPAQLPASDQPLTLQQRAELLYPRLDRDRIPALLEQWERQPGGAANRLAALAEEHRQLQQELAAWQTASPTHHPETGEPLTPGQRRYERRNRQLMARQLEQAWLRETDVDQYFDDPARNGHTLRLDIPIMGELPNLSAHFDHVSLLSLIGTRTTRGAQAFLSRFQRVRHLEVRHTPLGSLPAQVHTWPNLNTLSLSDCNIVLTAANQVELASMSRLQTLALDHNPLGLVPDVQALHNLMALDLTRTGIDRVPAGLLNRPELEAAILSDNRISELPEAIYNQPATSSYRLDLSNNPLSGSTLQRVKAYFQVHGTCWEADAHPTDIRDAQRLYPTLDRPAINRLIFTLPGNIEQGRIELARLAGELDRLQQQLSTWRQAPGQPALEQARRSALSQRLEDSWRRITTQETRMLQSLVIDQPLVGELPTLSARFDHVRSLVIHGNGGALEPAAFLDSFPALDILDIENAPLGQIPATILSRPNLTFLGLPRRNITLSAPAATALQGMQHLEYLDLSHNPLGRTPDFHQLPRLSNVLLADTGLREVPASLVNSVPRSTVNLSNNAIETLPEELFNLSAQVSRAYDLSGNPLSPAALEQVKRYSQAWRENFNAQAPEAYRERLLRLYPTFTEAEADRFIFRLPGTMDAVSPTLGRLEAEYAQLTTDLQQWMLDVPQRHPILDTPLDEAERARQQLLRNDFKTLLQQAWRREGAEDEESLNDELTHALVLDTPILGDLPQLSAHFDHVSWFQYTGDGTTTGLDGTLGCFPNLQSLVVTRCHLPALPQSLFSMRKLTSLELSHCQLRLSASDSAAIGDLADIEFLDLSENPLTLAPDVRRLSQLTSLHLRNTRIRELPRGVFQLSALDTLDVSQNQISHIPPDLLEMIPTFLEDCDLSGNPWSAQSIGRLRSYYLRTGMDFQVPEASMDEQGNPLSPPTPQTEEE